MATNNFLPFCPDDTGTNLLTQSEYAAADDRDSGNKPGIASSKLNNKAIRQSAYMVSQIAQYLSDKSGANLLDDAVPAKLLAIINSVMAGIAPYTTKYTSGSGTWNMSYQFFIATGSATAGATYTNNSVTFTVVATVASGLQIQMTGNGDPAVAGTLTKASGTGDATLTFYAFRKPTSIRIRLAGGGGGGGASGTASGADGSDGNDSTFGSSLLSGSKGLGGKKLGGTGGGGVGGAASLGTGPVGLAFSGGSGDGTGANGTGTTNLVIPGGRGGGNGFGGAGKGGGQSASAQAGGDASTNSGGGGGGAGTGTTATSASGGGGGAGGYVDALILSPFSSYAYVVGAGGAGGSAGTNGAAGGAGAAGIIIVQENY